MYRNQRRHFEPDTVRRKLIRAAMLASLLLIILLVLDRYGALPTVYDDENQGDSFPPRGDVRRVVSLAPSITELIFALHVDSLLVGVTKYCKYPPGADTLLEVGGFLDVNIEALIDIQPDLVVLLIEHEHVARRLRQLEIPYLIVNHQSVDGILESYQSVGKLLHADNVADSLQMAHREKINRARELTQNLRRPSVLLSIGHTD
ncbi:MAG: helical backbone metal receptor, partial [Candidatus Zixiibacteriota bacterium]